MEFEYDRSKSERNLKKHGVDFEEAQELWSDPYMVRFAVEYGGERRWGVIARLFDGLWTAFCTMRGRKTRIISVRRATPKEVSLYDKEHNDR